MKTFEDILAEEDVKLSDVVKRHDKSLSTCPKCSDRRKKSHKKIRCLAIWDDDRGVRFHCIHCGWSHARFYDEGNKNDVAKARTQHGTRGVAGRCPQDSERDRGRDRDRLKWEKSGVRVSQERRVHIPENPDDGQKILDRARGERVVLVQRGLPERAVLVGRSVDHLRGGTGRRIVVGSGSDPRRVRS